MPTSPQDRAPAARALARAALLVLLASACAPDPRDAPRPHVIVWLMDTLRADHLSCYGYARPTSPRLDALAAGGVLFEQAHVHSNWTQPSVASLLSARYPLAHAADFSTRIPEDAELAAEWFGRHGYETAGFTTTVAVARRFGFAQGFETYGELDALRPMRERERRAGADYDAERLVDAATAWLDRRPPDARPFFLYLHGVDTHEPYEPHPGYPAFGARYDGPLDGSVQVQARIKRGEIVPTPEDVQHLVDLYDGEIAYADAQLGRLVDALETRGLLEDVLLVVLSDHGQEFFERGETGHGHGNLLGELTHVPLVMHWPRGLPAGVRVPGLVRGIDVVPTLLALCGLPALPDADGRALVERVRAGGGADARADDPVFVQRARRDGPVFAVRTGDWVLVETEGVSAPVLYDAEPDAPDAGPVRGQAQVEAALAEPLARWRALLEAREAAREGGEGVPLDEPTRRALEELGYLR